MKVATNVSPKHLRHDDHLLSTRDPSRVDFLKAVSHDLRTPLNVIIGICQFLERDEKTPLSPLHRDAVERMERNAHTLLRSVTRLMEDLRSGELK